MKFILGLQTVSTILVIVLSGNTNSKTVETHFSNLESNATSIRSHGLMTEPSRRTRRYARSICGQPPEHPKAHYIEGSNHLPLICESGYKMHDHIICNSEGKWSHKPICVLNNAKIVEPPFVNSSIGCPPPYEQYNNIWWWYYSGGDNPAMDECVGDDCVAPLSILSWSHGTRLRKRCFGDWTSEPLFRCDSTTGKYVSMPSCIWDCGNETAILERMLRDWLRCKLPLQPKNGRYRLEKSHCQSGEHCDIPNGLTSVPSGTHFMLTCNPGYKVNGTMDVFCASDGKLTNDAECIEIRCEALSSESRVAECTYNNKLISCESPVPPGTIAFISCRGGYQLVAAMMSIGHEEVGCGGDGNWNREPLKCFAECGKLSPDNKIVIAGGQLAKTPEFPWHATLYRSTRNGSKEMICGATIIQKDLLITAAHCVVAEATNRLGNPNTFSVATGNVFRPFNFSLEEQGVVQMADVTEIFVRNFYLGFRGSYNWDIAILKIKRPFTYSAICMPACLELSETSDRLDLEPGKFGKFAGFGKTATGEWSQALQMLTVPYVSLNDCKNASKDPENDKFITIDKFCAGYRNGSSACDGDSGGGLVFKSRGLWYLRGVISAALGAAFPDAKFICEKGSYTLSTRISQHHDWIKEIVDKHARA